MAAKQQIVKIVFQGDTALIKRAETEIRRETKVTQDQIRNDQNKTIKNLFDQTNKIKGHFSSLSNKTLGALGLGFGLHSLVSSAGQFIGQIGRVGDELTGLSDQFGSVNKAVGIYYSGLGSSFASMGQVKSAMMELGNEGIKLDDNFKALTFQVADFSQITGVSTGAIANLAGEIKNFGMANKKDMRDLLNSVVSIGLTGHHATQVIQTIGKAVENLGYYANDGKKSVSALGKGISESVGFLTKLGVRAQTATTFMDKLTDPEQYGEMAGLLNRINISQADYFNMLRTEGGKKTFFDKLKDNLPAIADQIMAINNPMAQRDFAKSLGVPMEIASKLAGKTRGEIKDIIAKSMTDKKALEKKESQGKANQERFTDMLEMFKMNALMPLMQFMIKFLPEFMKGMGFISDFVKRALGSATGYLDKFTDMAKKVFQDSNSLGELLQNAIAPVFEAFTTILGDAIGAFLNPSNWAKIFSGLWSMFSKLPLWAQLLGGFMIFKRMGGFFTGLVSGFRRGLTPANPLYTKESGGVGGGGGILDSVLGKKRVGLGGGVARVGGMFGAGGAMSSLTGGLSSGLAALANPIGLTVAALAGLAAVIYAVHKTYESFTETGKKHLSVLYEQGNWEQARLNMAGKFLGTQETLLDGLTADESFKRKELMILKERGQLLPNQVKRLDELNAKMETTNVKQTDIFATILGKIAGLFSSDGMMTAKISLALSNFRTWLSSNFSQMILDLKNSIPGFGLSEKMDAANLVSLTEKKLNLLYSGVAAGTVGVGQLQATMQEYQTLATRGNTGYLREYGAAKAKELQDRIDNLNEYEARKRNFEAAEAAKRHAEIRKDLGGIGGGINKVAENTAPEKNPVREAFKELALTNTQIMETQYAGSNFSGK